MLEKGRWLTRVEKAKQREFHDVGFTCEFFARFAIVVDHSNLRLTGVRFFFVTMVFFFEELLSACGLRFSLLCF